jgi:hypothetical protein
MSNTSFFVSLDKLQKIYSEAHIEYDKDAEKFWDNLSYADKLMAFYIVTKRIHKGDIIDRGSYRHVLYDVFGFDMDSYIVGMDSGYMDVHNSIVVYENDQRAD